MRRCKNKGETVSYDFYWNIITNRWHAMYAESSFVQRGEVLISREFGSFAVEAGRETLPLNSSRYIG